MQKYCSYHYDYAGLLLSLSIIMQVPDEMLVERVVGRRSDPETGLIYHLKFRPPPSDIVDRLVQRSDDTEEMAVARLKTYHSNVDSVLSYYQDILVEVTNSSPIDCPSRSKGHLQLLPGHPC